jgi:hypothetical protein
MEQQKTISPEDLRLVLLTDDVEEAISHIRKYIEGHYEVKKKSRPMWWLFEKV